MEYIGILVKSYEVSEIFIGNSFIARWPKDVIGWNPNGNTFGAFDYAIAKIKQMK